ncbi:arylsulfatase [Algoriphagus pacificus]|uniref:Arylsulfatase n=1 Tax=Algoriphagus pacificus TaxID=2811234 RepID=A0ABS3CBY9_9BACT|nr:arylsulfatase [Algoriphagus pacificus]MBN7814627.1 arylsulfatase [Algoriphagus pacificus]
MKFPASLLFGLIFLVSFCQPKAEETSDSRPNILLIVADDLGYADIGAFGGDIATPNLDALAASGIRFSRFHTAPVCAVTRAMLLSGNDNHVAGMGSQDLVTDVAGYEGHLSDRIVPFPILLQQSGYFTFMAGKWHLGLRPEDNPAKKGFDRSFVTLEGGANHFSNRLLFPDSPELTYGHKSLYSEDGEKSDWPEGAYSTDYYTEKLISYIDANLESGKPFFGFAAYTSPHWPLQVPENYWKKYQGKFDEGYEILREKRFESLKKSGLIPQDAILPATHPSIKPWESLSPEEKAKEARKMELYAGMVENLDENIGKILDHLKSKGEYDNTLIVFMSDNGAAGNDFYYSSFFGPYIQEHYTDAFEEMGTEKSFISYGPQWAEAGSAPFRYFKGYTTEGGINTPMIIAGPGVENKGEINHSFLTLMDFAPTFYELANVQYPNEWNGKVVKPLLGESILPLLSGKSDSVHDSTYVFGLEHRGYSMIRKGDWKIVNIDRPFLLENFQLLNLKTDLAEQIDLKEIHPEKYQEMLREWESFSKEVGVVYPTPSPESN